MSIQLRVLQHHSAAEHSLLAQQLAAPAKAAMSQCSATAWHAADDSASEAPALGASDDEWHWLVGCTAAVGPGMAFRLGAMFVGPRLAKLALGFCD